MIFRAVLKLLMQVCVLMAVISPVQAGHLNTGEVDLGGEQIQMAAEMPECGMLCDMSAAECAMHLQCWDAKILPPVGPMASQMIRTEFSGRDKCWLSRSLIPASPPPRFC